MREQKTRKAGPRAPKGQLLIELLHRQWWREVEESPVPTVVVDPTNLVILGANGSFRNLMGHLLKGGGSESFLWEQGRDEAMGLVRDALAHGKSGPRPLVLRTSKGEETTCYPEARKVLFQGRPAVELKLGLEGITDKAAHFFRDLTQIAPYFHDFDQVLDRIVERFAQAVTFHAFALSTVERGELARMTIFTGLRPREEFLGKVQEEVIRALLNLGVSVHPARLSYSIREKGWIKALGTGVVRSQVVLPIPIDPEDGIHGVGGLFHHYPEGFRGEDVGLFATFVGGIASSYLIYRSFKRAEEESQTDALTGLKNRRGAINQMASFRASQPAPREPLSLMVVDIDFFKEINDKWGHRVGDMVLKELGEVLRSSVRDVDLVARWGGEEFLVVLPGVDVSAARKIAERVREEVASMCIEVPSGSISASGAQIRITVSVGVTQLRENEEFQGAIERADRMMYRAKSLGRNRVIGDRVEEL
jgi:diguanylate cyclase (GGDEF)-like protein